MTTSMIRMTPVTGSQLDDATEDEENDGEDESDEEDCDSGCEDFDSDWNFTAYDMNMIYFREKELSGDLNV